MLTLQYIKKLADHYIKMFGIAPEEAQAISDSAVVNNHMKGSLIFVAPPTQLNPYFMLATIGMSQHRQKHTRTPYTELVMTLPQDWMVGSNDSYWSWPIDILKKLINAPVELKQSYPLYSSFALNDNFDTFAYNTDKCAAIFTPLAQFDNKKFGKLRVSPTKTVHFMQVLTVSKYVLDMLDRGNRRDNIKRILDNGKHELFEH